MGKQCSRQMVAEAALNLENTEGLNIMFLFFIFLNSYLVSALDEFLTPCSWFKKWSGMLLSLCDFNTILLREQICVFQLGGTIQTGGCRFLPRTCTTFLLPFSVSPGRDVTDRADVRRRTRQARGCFGNWRERRTLTAVIYDIRCIMARIGWPTWLLCHVG